MICDADSRQAMTNASYVWDIDINDMYSQKGIEKEYEYRATQNKCGSFPAITRLLLTYTFSVV